jgi:hypothetical protein
MQMLEFIEELAKKICEIELCVSNLRCLALRVDARDFIKSHTKPVKRCTLTVLTEKNSDLLVRFGEACGCRNVAASSYRQQVTGHKLALSCRFEQIRCKRDSVIISAKKHLFIALHASHIG